MKSPEIKQFGLIFFMFWCGFHKVTTASLGSISTLPQNQDFYEKHLNPINFEKNFAYTPKDIEGNIKKYFNDSDVGLHSSEDKVDFDLEFKNESFFKQETLNNGTQVELYHLINENINQSQSLNSSDYSWKVINKTETTETMKRKEGTGNTTDDFFSDGETKISVQVQKFNDEEESSEIDETIKIKKKHKKMFSKGGMNYAAKNKTFEEDKKIFSNFTKTKDYIRDDLAKTEKLTNEKKFNQSKNILQRIEKAKKWESENITESEDENYTKDENLGVETLRRKCLNHLKQENQFNKPGTTFTFQKNRKHKKTSFVKVRKNHSPTWAEFLENCQELLEENNTKLEISDGNKNNSKKNTTMKLKAYNRQLPQVSETEPLITKEIDVKRDLEQNISPPKTVKEKIVKTNKNRSHDKERVESPLTVNQSVQPEEKKMESPVNMNENPPESLPLEGEKLHNEENNCVEPDLYQYKQPTNFKKDYKSSLRMFEEPVDNIQIENKECDENDENCKTLYEDENYFYVDDEDYSNDDTEDFQILNNNLVEEVKIQKNIQPKTYKSLDKTTESFPTKTPLKKKKLNTFGSRAIREEITTTKEPEVSSTKTTSEENSIITDSQEISTNHFSNISADQPNEPQKFTNNIPKLTEVTNISKILPSKVSDKNEVQVSNAINASNNAINDEVVNYELSSELFSNITGTEIRDNTSSSINEDDINIQKLSSGQSSTKKNNNGLSEVVNRSINLPPNVTEKDNDIKESVSNIVTIPSKLSDQQNTTTSDINEKLLNNSYIPAVFSGETETNNDNSSSGINIDGIINQEETKRTTSQYAINTSSNNNTETNSNNSEIRGATTISPIMILPNTSLRRMKTQKNSKTDDEINREEVRQSKILPPVYSDQMKTQKYSGFDVGLDKEKQNHLKYRPKVLLLRPKNKRLTKKSPSDKTTQTQLESDKSTNIVTTDLPKLDELPYRMAFQEQSNIQPKESLKFRTLFERRGLQ